MKASKRRKVNRVRGLFDTNSPWLEEDQEMERVANNYFQELFQSTNPQFEAIDQILDATPVCISEEQNLKLIASFIREEIHGVVKGMHPTKALGPDDVQAIFYQKILGGDGKGCM